MRFGSVCSTMLHGAVVAAIIFGFMDDGGAPDQGGGGAQAIEVVLYSPEDGTNAETPLESDAEIAEEIEEASIEAPPPPAPQRPATRKPPPAPKREVTQDIPPIVVPIGEEQTVPPPPAPLVEMPEDLETLLDPPPLPTPVVELPEDLEALLDPPPDPVIEETPPDEQPVVEDITPPEKPERKVTLPETKQAVAKRKEPVKDPQKTDQQQTVGTPGQQVAVAPQQGTQQGTEASPSDAGAESTGVAPGKMTSYKGLLQAWLEKHKRYPDTARRRKHEGTVTVQFTMDGQGNVLSHKIMDSSGSEYLDEEVEKLLERASPLPAPPVEITSRTWIVPINFNLN